ncbi:glycoside hydrolase family 95 protein [Persicitalea jodogahamensis]|uniref:Alpha-L-fucosidase n=1 Tax=Persicitalea jodogahamensis TaxID=402147 RepID=A0A8J3DCT5_9BACT|nr:glycoside hydrolase family 95 protein [Persicitalea jodogahamensis]GHB84777.1 hypothetical protein GCM10007390_44960 [Persicitalea jodogahamensis]
MKSRILIFLFMGFVGSLQAQPLQLWYDRPAATWEEALPVGNGRLGAMIWGTVDEELIQLNESTLWAGGPVDPNPNPKAATYLPAIRKALFAEDYTKADQLTKKMQGLFTESYAPLGDIVIKSRNAGEVTNYRRELDLATAVATTTYTKNDTQYRREIFSSAPDEVIIIHLTASQAAALSFDLETKSLLQFVNVAESPTEIAMRGKAPAHAAPSYQTADPNPIVYEDPTGCKGMRYDLRVKVIYQGGRVTADKMGLHVESADEVTLFVSAATSFNGFDKCPDSEGKDEIALASDYLNRAIEKPYEILKSTHQEDYQRFFNRVSLQLGDAERDEIPTDQRLKAYTEGAADPAFEALYFQYGRYLLISSSRPGTQAANLQGIWNPLMRPPWSSNYTTNINAEMNYWPAEVTNLSEMHEPFIDLIGNIATAGRATAKNFYGAKGWTLNHNSDIWATTNPVGQLGEGDPSWANWPMGGAWLCQHLYDHYRFTRDVGYLQKTAYPLMKDAAAFCLDWLVENKSGQLVTVPSTSPENRFIGPDGKVHEVSVATTMDMSLIWDLFTNLIEASEVLNVDEDYRQVLTQKRAKLFPLQVGKRGNLQEWYKDFADREPLHRHVSHLYGLYPGRQISPITTPAFAKAAEKTLEIRGDGGTGWSKAWKINFWARLLDGDHAYKLLRELLTYVGTSETIMKGGGTYANLFCAHPPFQIDGNFGGIAGMAEMLIQSHLQDIQLLPALPAAWAQGTVKGLRARGDFEIDMAWEEGKLSTATVRSEAGGTCRIRTLNPVRVTGTLFKREGNTLVFETEAGKAYRVVGE